MSENSHDDETSVKGKSNAPGVSRATEREERGFTRYKRGLGG